MNCVWLARSMINEIRENVSWVSQNGIPGHRDRPTQLQQLVRNLADRGCEVAWCINKVFRQTSNSKLQEDVSVPR